MADGAEPAAENTRAVLRAGHAARWENVRRGMYRFRSNTMSMVGLGILLVIFVIAILAPWIVPHPDAASTGVNPADRFTSPDGEYLFGTDRIGRDIFSRVLLGTGLALRVGTTIIVLATTIGVVIGAVAAYFGGWIDDLLMRITDMFLAVPALVLAIAVTAALGPGINNAMIGLALTWWPGFARLARSQIVSLREEPFVEAIRGLGARNLRILFRHVLPNAVSPIIVKMTTDFGNAVLAAAALGFIGIGAQPPTPEWGAMINEGREHFPDQWWIATFPGMAIWLMVFSWNLLGDGLRDVLDPHSRR